MSLAAAEAKVRARYEQAKKGAENAEERNGDYMDKSVAEWEAEAHGLMMALWVIKRERAMEKRWRK